MLKINSVRNPLPPALRANDSYTFLMKELERVDQKIYEPLTGTDWPRDMPVVTGGGLTESIVSVDVTYRGVSAPCIGCIIPGGCIKDSQG